MKKLTLILTIMAITILATGAAIAHEPQKSCCPKGKTVETKQGCDSKKLSNCSSKDESKSNLVSSSEAKEKETKCKTSETKKEKSAAGCPTKAGCGSKSKGCVGK